MGSRRTLRQAHLSFFIITAIASYPLLDAAIARMVDGVRVTLDARGVDVVSADSHGGLYVRALLILAIWAACLLVTLASAVGSSRFLVSWASPYFVTAGISIYLHGYTGSGAILILTSIVIALAAGAMIITPEILGRVGLFLGACAVFVLLYALVEPSGWSACRLDKCSPAGRLLQGPFFHENALAVAFALTLPIIAYIRSRPVRLGTLTTVIVCILLSGSRSSAGTVAAALAAYLLLGRMHVRDQDRRRHDLIREGARSSICTRTLTALGGLAPLVSFLAAFILMYTAEDDMLKSRGIIWRVVADGLAADPVFGPGRGYLRFAFDAGRIEFLANHEHSQAAYVVGNIGLVGFALFICALIQAAWRSCSWNGGQFALLLFPSAIAGMTEPIITSDMAGVPITLLFLCFLCASARPPRARIPHFDVTGTSRPEGIASTRDGRDANSLTVE